MSYRQFPSFKSQTYDFGNGFPWWLSHLLVTNLKREEKMETLISLSSSKFRADKSSLTFGLTFSSRFLLESHKSPLTTRTMLRRWLPLFSLSHNKINDAATILHAEPKPEENAKEDYTLGKGWQQRPRSATVEAWTTPFSIYLTLPVGPNPFVATALLKFYQHIVDVPGSLPKISFLINRYPSKSKNNICNPPQIMQEFCLEHEIRLYIL